MQPDKKEEWIAETLASLRGAQQAEAPAGLAEKVLQHLAPSRAMRATLPPRTAWAMAACAVFLLGVNVFACLQFGRSTPPAQKAAAAFAKEYFASTPTLSL